MKRVEELGISPMPWKAFGEPDESDSIIHYVYDANWNDINKSYLMQADACLISAAPELYNELRTALLWIECHDIYGNMARDILRDGYAALAKASGDDAK